MNDTIEKRIQELKIIPVVKIENAQDAVPLGRALMDGGLPVAEITFRTNAAHESIGNLARDLPELCVGAGTVLTIKQVNMALDAGARFILTPGFNTRIVDYCINRDIPIFPGANSPTQIDMGLERELRVLKFFPAEASGGIGMLQAMSDPYGGIRFMPTGGINAQNIADYLGLPGVIACGGSWMVHPKLISEENFDEVTRLTREALASITDKDFL